VTRDEALELLPLYAGGDLEPELRLRVEQALAADPSLREALQPFEQVDAMLVAALAEPETLSLEAARELLPLHAGGDLAPHQRERVQEALEAHPQLEAELEPFQALETMVGTAFAEEASEERPALRVKVQCPFCHDALASAPRVLCADCATPHHDACFAQNAGCSLLGCEGTRSVAAEQRPLRVCAECEQQTPADAPFCAYCGHAQALEDPAPRSSRLDHAALEAKDEADPAPLHVRLLPKAADAWRFAAAAALLLVSGLSVGAMFGLQQRAFLEALASQAAPPTLEAAERELPLLLQGVSRANERFAREDLEEDGRLDYAADFPELWRALRDAVPREALATEYPALVQGLGSAWYEILLAASPTRPDERWFAVASLRAPSGAPQLGGETVYFVNHTGQVIALSRQRLDIDPHTCELQVSSDLEELRQAVQAVIEKLPAALGVELGADVVQIQLRRESDLVSVHAALPESLLRRIHEAGLGVAFVAHGNRRAFWGADMFEQRATDVAPAQTEEEED
jgi:hypothetical protein